MAEWISVEERLPEIGLDVLAYCKAQNADFSDFIDVAARKMYKPTPWSDEEPVWGTIFIPFGAAFEVTHWMPLPEPPKEEK